jgi:hypothetical protein
MDICNVIATKWLAKRCLERTMGLPSDGNSFETAGPKLDSPVRIIMKLRATIEARVPVGYEDENGFHYGAGTAD